LFISCWIKGDKAKLFLKLSNDLLPSRCATLLTDSIGDEEIDNMIRNFSTSDKVLFDGMWDRETFVDWNCVGKTISGIAYKTSGSAV